MKKALALPLAAVVASAVAAVVLPSSAYALPTSVQVTVGHNPTGARFTAGTGHIRAWQLCETSNGQTDFYQTGPWEPINVWSWTGSCQNYRSHGFDVTN